MRIKTVLAALSLISIATVANAKDKMTENWPELKGDQNMASASASTSMKCFVDTPAYDHYTTGSCFAAGSSRTTTAVFKIDGGPGSNYKVIWSDSRCSQTSKTCFLPIRWYQSITLSADVLDLSTNTFSSSSATAHYEGFF